MVTARLMGRQDLEVLEDPARFSLEAQGAVDARGAGNGSVVRLSHRLSFSSSDVSLDLLSWLEHASIGARNAT